MTVSLALSVTRETFRWHGENKTLSPDYAKNKPLALRRDKFTCQGCGFCADSSQPSETAVSRLSVEYSKYLTMHHLNDNHLDDKLDNLITLCPFCHSVFHAGCTGHINEARVIFYPWLSQAEINLMVNLLISGQANSDSAFAETLTLLYEHFETHTLFSESPKLFEQGMSDPSALSSALLSLFYKSPAAYARRSELLAGLRLLPVAEAYTLAGEAWVNEWRNEAEWQRIGESWSEQ